MTHVKARQRKLAGAAVAAIVLAGSPAAAQDRTIAFTGARILTMAGETIDNGTLVIRDGRIVAVGSNVAVPADAERRAMEGQVINARHRRHPFGISVRSPAPMAPARSSPKSGRSIRSMRFPRPSPRPVRAV